MKKYLARYLNIELSARHIENVRLALPQKHSKTIGRSKLLLDWPRSQEKFLTPRDYQYFLNHQLILLNSNFLVNFHEISKSVYKDVKNDSRQYDNIKFKVVRDYFAIQRLIIISSAYSDTIQITIEYRTGLSTYAGDLSTNNHNLLGGLKYQEDVICKFEIPEIDFRSKARCCLIPFIFNNEKLFPDRPLSLKHRGDVKTSIKNRGYILEKDHQTFMEISRVSYNNMMKLVKDKELFEQIRALIKDYEQNKKGI